MSSHQQAAEIPTHSQTFASGKGTSMESSPSTSPSSRRESGLFLLGIFAGLSFIAGFILFESVLADLQDEDLTDLEQLQALADKEQIYYLSNNVIYVLFGGFAQLGLSLGLAEKASKACPQFSSYSKALGIIWAAMAFSAGMIGNIGAEAALTQFNAGDEASAATLWVAVQTLHNALGGGNEIVGGLWILLASYCHYKSKPQTGGVDKSALLIGAIAGVSGIVSTVPVFKEMAAAVFGVGMILWYCVVGIKETFS